MIKLKMGKTGRQGCRPLRFNSTHVGNGFYPSHVGSDEMQCVAPSLRGSKQVEKSHIAKNQARAEPLPSITLTLPSASSP